MKLIAHHFWKNVWGMRWLLALWFVLLAFQAWVEARASWPHAMNPDHLPWIANQAILGSLVINLAWILIVVRTIQAEPVVGTSSFWLTKPVPTAVSILSRLAIIVGLTIMPTLLLDTMVASLYQLPRDAVVDMAIWSFVPQSILMLLTIWLATYTRNLMQFWAAAGVLVVILIGSEAVEMALRLFQSTGGTHFDMFWIVEWPWICGVAFVGGLVISLMLQYMARAIRPALVIGLAAIVFMLLGGFTGMFVFLSFAQHALHPDSFREPVQIGYQLDTSRPLSWTSESDFGGSNPGGDVIFQLIPPPRDDRGVPVPEFVNGWLQVDNGPRAEITTAFLTGVGGNPDLAVDWAQRLRQDHLELKVIDPMPKPAIQSVAAYVRDANAAQVKGKRGTVHLDIDGYFLHLADRTVLVKAEDRLVSIPGANIAYTFQRAADGGLTLRIDSEAYLKSAKPMVFVVLFIDAKDKIGVVGQQTSESVSPMVFSGFGQWSRISQSNTIGFDGNTLPSDAQSLVQAMRPDDWRVEIYQPNQTNLDFETKIASGPMTF